MKEQINIKVNVSGLDEALEKAKELKEILGSLRVEVKAIDEPESRWIPCSERLPADGMQVLFSADEKTHAGEFSICLNTGFYDLAEWNDEESDGYYHVYDVDAWMPLPEPYNDAKQDVHSAASDE